jgi:hypothetical protein
MAGDWIKFRSCLLRHPKVVRIASALKADKFRTLGGLMSVWCLFDEQTEDGFLDSYTLDVLDAEVGFPGISLAMQSVGWLEETPEGLVLPEFETHNGASAKRRAQDADRKREVRKMSAPEADEKRTREEKRREDKTIAENRFAEFWGTYPRKDSKASALKAFLRIAPDEQLFAAIIAGVKRAETSEQWRRDKGKYIPYAATWLNQERWTDSGTSAGDGVDSEYEDMMRGTI